MHKYFLLALSFIILRTAVSSAQKTDIDSIFNIWLDESKTDSVRVNAYVEYIKKGFLYYKPDSTIILAEALIAYGKEHNYPMATGYGYSALGSGYLINSDYENALTFLKKSLSIRDEIGDEKGKGNTLTNIGLCYSYQSNHSLALQYYEKALLISEKLEDKKNSTYIFKNIGNIYFDQGDYPRALEYYEKCLPYDSAANDQRNLGSSLLKIGQVYNAKGNSKSAFEYFERSLAIGNKLDDKGLISANLASIGSIHQNQGNYSLALEKFEESLVILEDIGNNENLTSILTGIGQIYKKQGKLNLALEYCQNSLMRGEDLQLLYLQKSACKCLYDTYKAMGKGNDALMYLEKIQEINDSLNTEQTNKMLQQMEYNKKELTDSIAQAEKDRLLKEEHIEEVRKSKQTRNLLIGVSAIVILLALSIYTRLSYVRKSKAALQVEKDQSENLLLNILPAEIAKELKEKGKADARDFDLVSILFTDFKEFTQASEKLSAKDLVAEINTCFEAFDAICEKYNIEKIKTIGDSYMAAGGLPVSSDDSVKNTVLAAHEMQEFITTRNKELLSRPIRGETRNFSGFKMRCGIHTGPVVAGIVGVKKFQYDIWGDTVNTASRMESHGEVGKVNISEATYLLLKDDASLSFEAREELEIKGKGLMKTYFVALS